MHLFAFAYHGLERGIPAGCMGSRTGPKVASACCVLTGFLGTVIVFGCVILAHELGHFLVAKLSGVAVERLSVGFGPALWAVRSGETEYRISLLPLGGYVKLAGQSPGATVRSELTGRSYRDLPLRWRSAILAAGPTANMLAALVLFSIIFLVFGLVRLLPVVGSVAEHSPAARAGMQPGDRIVSVDGRVIDRWEQLGERLAGKAGKTVTIAWLREGERRKINLVPQLSRVDSADGRPTRRALIGITPAGDTSIERVSVLEALEFSARETWQLTKLSFVVLYRLATGKLSLGTLAGPVGIAQMSSQAARAGVHALLTLTGILSVNIAVLNLLPIPVFDGGGLLFVLIEAVRKRPLRPEVEQRAQLWSVALLVILTLVVLQNDIARLGTSP